MEQCRGIDRAGEPCRRRFWLSVQGYCADHDPGCVAGSVFVADFRTLPDVMRDTIRRELADEVAKMFAPVAPPQRYSVPVRRRIVRLSILESLEMGGVRVSRDTITGPGH